VFDIVNSNKFKGYDIRREVWQIAGQSFELMVPANVDALLDTPYTQQRFAENEYMPYWAESWPAAGILAEAVLLGENGKGRSAVEIGCGIGLVSIAAAMMGWSVTASDYDSDALAFAKLNAQRNGVKLTAVKWIDVFEPSNEPSFHCILGSDLTYETRMCQPLARWIASTMKKEGIGLISDPNRATGDLFMKYARQIGLEIYEEKGRVTTPEGQVRKGRIWRLRHQ